jgi:hypothetical protein
LRSRRARQVYLRSSVKSRGSLGFLRMNACWTALVPWMLTPHTTPSFFPSLTIRSPTNGNTIWNPNQGPLGSRPDIDLPLDTVVIPHGRRRSRPSPLADPTPITSLHDIGSANDPGAGARSRGHGPAQHHARRHRAPEGRQAARDGRRGAPMLSLPVCNRLWADMDSEWVSEQAKTILLRHLSYY